jgi:hypothetical protein
MLDLIALFTELAEQGAGQLDVIFDQQNVHRG